jgi:transcriptional regulator with XRE-family HTH domain
MKNLRKLRKRKGLSQAELSVSSGISQGSISKLENNGVRRLSTALKLAKALGLDDPRELFDVG